MMPKLFQHPLAEDGPFGGMVKYVDLPKRQQYLAIDDFWVHGESFY